MLFLLWGGDWTKWPPDVPSSDCSCSQFFACLIPGLEDFMFSFSSSASLTWEVLLVLSICELWVTCQYHIWIQTRFRLPPWPSCWPALTHSSAGPITPRPGSLPLQREQQQGGLSAQLWGLGQHKIFLYGPSCTLQRALKKLWWEQEVSFIVYMPNLSPVYAV